MSWWAGESGPKKRRSTAGQPKRGKRLQKPRSVKTGSKRAVSSSKTKVKAPSSKVARKASPAKRKVAGSRSGAKRRSVQKNRPVELVKVDFFPFGLFARKTKKTKKRRSNYKKQSSSFGVFPFVYWGSVCAIWGMIAFGGLITYYSVTLPDPLLSGLKTKGQAIRVLAKDGSLIAERGLHKNYVKLSQLPKPVVQAVIAIEDRRFYSHFGFDPLGFTRAMVANVKAKRFVQGGSTITQQLAKNLFLNSERTLARKLREMGLALWLETKFEKDEIIELYLNRVYFGAQAYGIDQAARVYFGKRAHKLSLTEGAMLAGLLKAPSKLNPKRNYKLAKRRAHLVLGAMQEAGFISPLTAKTAQLAPAQLRKRYLPINSNYIADWIADLVPEYVSDYKSDLVVKTSIDPALQNSANKAVMGHLKRNGKVRRVSQAAMVVMAPNGAVRAIVGGRDYQTSQFNRAVHSRRQTGSVFKPVVYLAALEAGFEPTSLIFDRPTRFNKWRPRNYKNEYRGQISLQHALAVSSNVVAVKLMNTVGVAKTVETARRLGLGGKFEKDLSLALGTTEQSLLDMTAAYVPFANGGRATEPFVITKISTKQGKLLYRAKKPALDQVVSGPHVNQMNHMLRGVVKSGTGKQAKIITAQGWHDFAGKTGTTQKFRDGWFVGYSAYYITGVWVGNDDGSAMKRVTGGGLPTQMWTEVMSRAHSGLAPKRMIATSKEPVRRDGWREVGMVRRIKPKFFEQALR